MAKTLKTLITEAVNLSDEAGFDNVQWVGWLNAAIDDIAPVLYIDSKITIAKTGEGFLLPENYISAIRIDGIAPNLKLLDPADDISSGYKIIGNTVILQKDSAAEIVLWYYKVPTYFDTSAITAPLDEKLAAASRSLEFYACAMAMLHEDESERYDLYIGLYNNSKAVINQNNLRKKAGRAGTWGVIR